jgi:hypothetical protein
LRAGRRQLGLEVNRAALERGEVPGADAMRLDEAAEVFRSHPLDAGPYTFVAADTLVLKVRENGRVVRTFSLVDSDTKVDVNTGIVPTVGCSR